MDDGYKEVQIGPKTMEIPEEWKVIPFGDVYHKRNHKMEADEGAIRYVGLKHLETKNIHIIGFDENGKERSSNRGFKEGDILFGKLRPYLEKVAIAPFNGICSSDIIPIYSNKKSINRYLLYLMYSQIMKSRTISTMEGTNLPRTSWSSLSSYEIPLPPLPEQRRIAEILSTVDDAIQKTNEVIKKAERLKKGLMQDLLTKGIGHDEFKEVFLGPRTKIIPKEWNKTKLGQISEILDKHRVPLNSDEREKMKGDIPYYGANGVVDYVDDYLFDEKLLLIAEDGGHFEEHKTRPISYIIEGKSWVNNHAHILRIKDGAITEWVYYSTVHKNILPYVHGSTRKKLNQKELKKIEIPLPPLPEQRQITEILSSLDNKIQTEKSYKEKLQILKKGLMQDLLTGKVRVNDIKIGDKNA